MVCGAFLKLFLVNDRLLLSFYTFVVVSMLAQRSINKIKTLNTKNTLRVKHKKNLGFLLKSLNDLLWSLEPTSSLTQVCKFLGGDEIPLLGLFFVVSQYMPSFDYMLILFSLLLFHILTFFILKSLYNHLITCKYQMEFISLTVQFLPFISFSFILFPLFVF